MIISFHHHFIFIAIPKTATHAFRMALRPHLASSDWEQCVLFEKKFFPVEALAQIGHGHISCRQIQPFLLPEIWEKSFKFATVRNPYERFISYCYFINRENQLMQHEPLGTMKQIIEDKQSAGQILFRPQNEFVTDNEGNLMIDFVCKFEELQDHFDTVCQRLNFPFLKLQRVNVTNPAPAGVIYDRELKEMVQAFYQKDFDLFDYSTELVETK